MSLLSEFQQALRDGQGAKKAAAYKLVIWPELEAAAVAYSRSKNEALLLILAERDFEGLSGNQYLDVAKTLNSTFGWFCSPAQRIGPHTLWGGKTSGPVYVYRFNVLNEPKSGEMA